MDPISTGLAGITLVQKSVEFIKSNINTANDIKDIAGAIDGLFAGRETSTAGTFRQQEPNRANKGCC